MSEPHHRRSRAPCLHGRAQAPVLAVAVRSAAAALLLAHAGPAHAQSCGGCSGPGVGGGGGAQRTWLGEGAATIRFSYEYEVKDRSYRGRDRVANDFDEMLRTNRLAADVRFGITEDWTASIALHQPRFQYRVKPPGGARFEKTFRGPGDTSILAGRRIALGSEPKGPDLAAFADVLGPAAASWQQRFQPVEGPSLQVWAGVSAPTGTAEEPNPAFVTRDVSVSNLQTGTGTWDPLLRLRFDDPSPAWRPFAQLDVRWPVTSNRYDYRSGRSVALSGGVETDIVPGLRVNTAVTYQRVERDRFSGQRVGVGGAEWVYITPGIAYDLSPGTTIDASVRFTAWRDTQTKLSDGGVALQAGITFRF